MRVTSARAKPAASGTVVTAAATSLSGAARDRHRVRAGLRRGRHYGVYSDYYDPGYGGTSQQFAKNAPYGDGNITDLISGLKNYNASSHFA